jgi:SAM-dependent methyltransferase
MAPSPSRRTFRDAKRRPPREGTARSAGHGFDDSAIAAKRWNQRVRERSRSLALHSTRVMVVVEKCVEEALRDRTRAFYETHAERYAAVTLDADVGSLAEQLLTRLPRRARVLDLGCGAGRDTRRLLNEGYRAIGLDYAPTLLQIAAQASAGKLVDADLRCLPFKCGSFDAVWAVASLLHIPKRDIAGVLAGVAQIVERDGLLFTSMKRGVGEELDGEGRFFAFYSENEWLQYLQHAGWQPIHVSADTERRSDNNVEWLLTVSMRG